MSLTEAIGKRVLELTKINNYSLQELAKEANVPLSTIKNLIYNKTTNPSTMVIYKICKVFNMELNDFFKSDYFNKKFK